MSLANQRDFRDTLLLPFEQELIAPPSSRWLALNLQVLPSSNVDWKTCLDGEQNLRSVHLDLEQHGYRAQPAFDIQTGYEGGLVLLGRSRALNELNLTRAWNALRPKGTLVVAGDKKGGVAALRKWVAKQASIEGSLSKHHAITFWAKREGEEWSVPATVKTVDGYDIPLGGFSTNGPDTGSRLLANHFDNRIRGRVADFGAGWGYLTMQLMEKSTHIAHVDLYEVDWNSVDAIDPNVSKITAAQPKTVPFKTHWCDLTREAPSGPYDWIIMNPPFHTSRAADPGLGQKFITAAASALPSGGRLLMVANRTLPYEAELQRQFRRTQMLEDRGGFKVLEAVR